MIATSIESTEMNAFSKGALIFGLPFTVMLSLLFSDYLSLAEHVGWPHYIAEEIVAVCRSAESQRLILVALSTYLIAFVYLERGFSKDSGRGHQGRRNVLLLGFCGTGLMAYAKNLPVIAQPAQVLVLMGCILLGKCMSVLMSCRGGAIETVRRRLWVAGLLTLLLAGAAFWHPNAFHAYGYRDAPRWHGAWDNPNTYGLLMGVGLLLGIGLGLRTTMSNSRRRGFVKARGYWLALFLFLVAVCATGLGLIKSYSRGAWVGAALALAYMAFQVARTTCLPTTANGPRMRRNAVPLGIVLSAMSIIAFWNWRHTEQTTVRRAFSAGNANDFSCRNRLAAWEGGLQMMAANPWFGFGWGEPEGVYTRFYRPSRVPDGAAVQMNDYVLLGSSIGITALGCFAMYLWLALAQKSKIENQESRITEVDWSKIACRAGAVVLAVGFWFDGGLFKLATATPFWILLELGKGTQGEAQNAQVKRID